MISIFFTCFRRDAPYLDSSCQNSSITIYVHPYPRFSYPRPYVGKDRCRIPGAVFTGHTDLCTPRISLHAPVDITDQVDILFVRFVILARLSGLCSVETDGTNASMLFVEVVMELRSHAKILPVCASVVTCTVDVYSKFAEPSNSFSSVVWKNHFAYKSQSGLSLNVCNVARWFETLFSYESINTCSCYQPKESSQMSYREASGIPSPSTLGTCLNCHCTHYRRHLTP